MARKESFFGGRFRGLPLVIVVGLVALQAPVWAEKGEKEKKGKNDPEKLLAKAQALYEQGKLEKAISSFELAAAQSDAACLECLVGMFRAAAGRGRFEEIVTYAGAALDAAGETTGPEDDKAVAEEVESVWRRALESTAGSDPDVLWGLIEVLARLERASEIVRLADRYLDTPEEKALICAADFRVSLVRNETLAVGDEVNAQLQGLGWDGPLLVSGKVLPPKLRNRSYTAGRGARMSGVIDRTGFLKDVRVVRPPPSKITMEVRDKVRRALFDPARYRGRRIAVCYPFSVTLPGQIQRAQQGGGGSGSDSSSLYTLIAGFDSADAILELVEKVGNEIALPKRAAVCAARDWHDELNTRLLKLDWPGPFFDTDDVQDPVPQHTPQPEYTEGARAAEVEGQVVLATVVSDTGRVVQVEVLEPLPEGLSGKAVTTVRTWTFEPAVYEGKKVAVCREITLEFKL